MAQNSNTPQKGTDSFLKKLINGPWFWPGAIAVVMLAFFMSSLFGQTSRQVDTNVGLQLLNDHQVKSAKIYDGDQRVELQLKEDYKKGNDNYGKSVSFYYVQPRSEDVVKAMDSAQLESYTDQPVEHSFLSSLVSLLLPILLFGVLFWFLMGRVGGGSSVMSFSKSRAKKFTKDKPDVRFSDVAGVDEALAELEEVREFLAEPEKFTRLGAKIPKGVLLYGPPGNGKTMIAKAVAHALSDGFGRGSGVFLSVKGPELLNKFVGESERLVRQIFTRARERAADGRPVIVFIDEMDSLLRTRGTGVSSDVETTIVPQFLSELDGVESLDNVMVIGASNRVDMIDPAVLRPGRLDVKIRVDRPGADQAASIIRHYLTDDLPLQPGLDADGLSRVLVRDIYTRSSRRHLCDACNDQGQWSAIFLSDVASGAMLKNIVDRAKTKAVKASILGGDDVALNVELLGEAVEDEFVETRGSVMDVDPVQWSRINGMDNGRVVRIRPVPRKEKENMQ